MNTSTTVASDDPQTSAGRAFEVMWPLTFVAVLTALWALWYLRVLDIGIGRIAWLLTAAAGVHVLAAPAMARIRSAHLSDAAYLALHGVSLGVLAMVWLLLGAMDLPVFLLFFAPPVITSPAIRGLWGRAAAFGLALAIIILTALLASPSLRWYGGQVGLPFAILDSWAARLLSLGAPAEQSVAPTAAAISLGLVAASLAALYACASSLSAASRRVIGALREEITELTRDKGVAHELLQSSPMPEALVLPDSVRIVLVNDRFRSAFRGSDVAPEGARLSEVVRPQFSEALERLVQSGDGVLDGRCPGPDGRLREVRMHVCRLKYQGTNAARISFEDRTVERQLQGALDALGDLLLVFDADDRLIHANTAARALFSAAAPGAAAAAVLRRADLPETWWRTPVDTSVPRQMSIAGNDYHGAVYCRRLEGMAEPLTVIALVRARAA
jgi:PAS domain-containing protein